MATEAPEKELNEHGEEESKALFGPGYDERKPLYNPDNKDNSPAGKSSDPRDEGLSSEELAKKEAESSMGIYTGPEKPSGFSRLRGRLNKNLRRRATIGVLAGVLGVGGFGSFAVLYPAFELIHFSQFLQRHFISNQDFGDSRLGALLYHTSYGKGVQQSRLGAFQNVQANKWEKKMAKETGLKPVYDKDTGRLRGFQVTDGIKSNELIGNNQNKLQENFGENSKVVQAKASDGFINSDGTPVKSGSVVSIDGEKFSNRRTVIGTISRATSTNKIVSTYSARLLKKRGGVTLHAMNRIKEKSDNWIAERRKLIADKASSGTKSTTAAGAATDQDGNSAQSDIDASNETKSVIKEFLDKGFVKSGLGGAALVGVLCTAKGLGSNIEDYKYTNQYLPLLRTGMTFISTGDQVRAMDDMDLDSIRVMQGFLHQNGGHFNQAESYNVESGGTGGKPMPQEADLRNIDSKPQFFRALDAFPGLGGVCAAQDAVFELPVIKQISGFLSSFATAAADQVLRGFGTSTEKLGQSALRAVAGKSVDMNGQDVTGADIGNFATSGSFIAANDAIIAQGGTALSNQQAAELKQQDLEYERQENASKSFFARYLDPFDRTTVTASLIDSSNVSNLASFFSNPLKNLGLSKLMFSNVLAADIIPYDYGIPKYGFSAELQRDSRFEDPDKNAKIVEDYGLSTLNTRYGECFGSTVVDDGNSLRIESTASVNVFKLDDKCKNNNTEMFLRYRFYLADAIAAISLACNQGDEAACANLGQGSEVAALTTQSPQTAGTTIDLNNLTNESTSISCAPGTKDLGIQDGYTNGNQVKIRICAVTGFRSTGEESNGGQGVSGAGGDVVVNSRVSGAVLKMFQDAKNDGVTLSANSSFRTMAHQTALCNADSSCLAGNYTYVAKPGTSNHQMGLAIDFSTLPASPGPVPGNQIWEWLSSNALGYGYKNYPEEAWHWSPTGN